MKKKFLWRTEYEYDTNITRDITTADVLYMNSPYKEIISPHFAWYQMRDTCTYYEHVSHI